MSATLPCRSRLTRCRSAASGAAEWLRRLQPLVSRPSSPDVPPSFQSRANCTVDDDRNVVIALLEHRACTLPRAFRLRVDRNVLHKPAPQQACDLPFVLLVRHFGRELIRELWICDELRIGFRPR